MPDPEIRLDFLSYSLTPAKGKLQAVFTPEYINDPLLRFRAYRRHALLGSISELDAFTGELRDRFGRLPESAENLLAVARLRISAKAKNISSVSVYDEKIVLERGHAVLKPGGFVPRIPSVMTPEEKLRRVFWGLEQV